MILRTRRLCRCSPLLAFLLPLLLATLPTRCSGNLDAAAAADAQQEDTNCVLQSVLSQASATWNVTGAQDEQNLQELVAQLQLVLHVARQLLRSPCATPALGRCPRHVPELLCNGTAAFLASTLDKYPDLRAENVAAWAAAANGFLASYQASTLRRHEEAGPNPAGTGSAARGVGGGAGANGTQLGSASAGGTRRLAQAAADVAAADAAGTAAADAAAGAASAVAVAAAGTAAGTAAAANAAAGEGTAAAAGAAAAAATAAAAGTVAAVDPAADAAAGAAADGAGTAAASAIDGAAAAASAAASATDGAGDVPDDAADDDAVADGDAAAGGGGGGGGGEKDEDIPLSQRYRLVTYNYDEPPQGAGCAASGLPLVRRVLLAQLLLAWLGPMGRVLPAAPPVAEALAALMRRLYEVHVDSVVRRSMQEHLHISKAGGTSWTLAAFKNGCRMPPRSNAARTRSFNDECRWMAVNLLVDGLGLDALRARRAPICPRYGMVERLTAAPTCAQRHAYSAARGYDYLSNEYTLHGGLFDMYDTQLCPQVVNVVSIREPLARLKSNVKYIMILLRGFLGPGPEEGPRQRFKQLFCNASADHWQRWATPVADNYHVRSFLGERAFHTPLGEVGQEHLALARALILQFDLVHNLDAGDDDASTLMRLGLGWKTTLAEVHIWSSERLARQQGLDFDTCPLGDIAPLLARQGPDTQLYSFGRALNRLDVSFLAAARKMRLRPWANETAEAEAAAAAVADGAWEAAPLKLLPPGRCGLFGVRRKEDNSSASEGAAVRPA